MKTILTVQHPQSLHHINGMVGSWTDWDLTDLGRQQAHNIGRKLAQRFPDTPFTLYSSDLLRARRTAEIIGAHMGLSPILARELRERDLGRCVGQSVQWLQEHMERQEHTVDDRMFSDGESRRDAWERLAPFYRSLTDSGPEHILIVSHGDLLGMFHAMWLGLEVEALDRCELSGQAGGVSFLYETQDGKHGIRCMSDLSFRDG